VLSRNSGGGDGRFRSNELVIALFDAPHDGIEVCIFVDLLSIDHESFFSKRLGFESLQEAFGKRLWIRMGKEEPCSAMLNPGMVGNNIRDNGEATTSHGPLLGPCSYRQRATGSHTP